MQPAVAQPANVCEKHPQICKEIVAPFCVRHPEACKVYVIKIPSQFVIHDHGPIPVAVLSLLITNGTVVPQGLLSGSINNTK